MNGSNPKFDVVDEDGVRWRVKMGVEAGPETAASRLVGRAGYFANEDYFMPVLHVQKHAAPAPREKSRLAGRHRAQCPFEKAPER